MANICTCRFIRRVMFFYKPTHKLFSIVELSHKQRHAMADAGCRLIDFLLNSESVSMLALTIMAWRIAILCIFVEIVKCTIQRGERRLALFLLFMLSAYVQNTCIVFSLRGFVYAKLDTKLGTSKYRRKYRRCINSFFKWWHNLNYTPILCMNITGWSLEISQWVARGH